MQVIEATNRVIDRMERLPAPLRDRAYRLLERFGHDFDRLLHKLEVEGKTCRMTINGVFDTVAAVWEIDPALLFSNNMGKHPNRHKARLQAANLIVILFPEMTRQAVGDLFARGDVCLDHSTVSVWIGQHRKLILQDPQYLNRWEACRRRMGMIQPSPTVYVRTPFRKSQPFHGQPLPGDQLAITWPEDRIALYLAEHD